MLRMIRHALEQIIETGYCQERPEIRDGAVRNECLFGTGTDDVRTTFEVDDRICERPDAFAIDTSVQDLIDKVVEVLNPLLHRFYEFPARFGEGREELCVGLNVARHPSHSVRYIVQFMGKPCRIGLPEAQVEGSFESLFDTLQRGIAAMFSADHIALVKFDFTTKLCRAFACSRH